MAEDKQKIRSILIPEQGLELEPEFIEESEVDTFFSRALAHLVGMVGNRSIMIRATTDGRLKVAAAGTSMEIYDVETGIAADAFNAGDPFEQANAIYVTDILVETFNSLIAFRNAAGVWGDEKIVNVGFMSVDLIHYGIRIRNRTGGSNAVYEISMYR